MPPQSGGIENKIIRGEAVLPYDAPQRIVCRQL